MTGEGDGIHVFSSGFEYDCWRAKNCDRCVKEPDCPLIDALLTDSLVYENIPNGSVTPETAQRLGYLEEYAGVLGWPCAERQTADEPPPPAAHEMASAGSEMLPGFGGGA